MITMNFYTVQDLVHNELIAKEISVVYTYTSLV